MELSIFPTLPAGMTAMVGGMVLIYAAAQSLSTAASHISPGSPGRRAFWHAGPIAAAAVVAAFLGHGDIALGILTGSAIVALSLAPGVSKIIAVRSRSVGGAYPANALLLAPVLLLWLIGLRAEINWLSASLLGAEGLLLCWVWREPRGVQRVSPLMCVIVFLATAVAAVASVLAIRGALRLQAEMAALLEGVVPLTPGIISAGLLAPILTLPLLGESVRLTEENRAAEAQNTQVALAMINLTALVPLCVLASYLRGSLLHLAPTGPIPFPLAIWRVDCLVLAILATWLLSTDLLPRWLQQVEGILLIVLYGAYLISLAFVELYLWMIHV